LAVADGVGGWSLRGVDPGIYARELCEKYAMESSVSVGRLFRSKKEYATNPKDLLVAAAGDTRSEGSR
jgi:hypothetical protein